MIAGGALLLAAIGVSLALGWSGLPTPFLLGGLLAALVYALARPTRPLQLPRGAFRGGQAIVGVMVGASIDLGSLRGLGADWVVVVLVACFSLVVSVAVGQLLVRRGVSRATATFASIAGGAAALTGLSRELGADDRVVAVLQYLRLIAVLVTLPVVVLGVFGERDDTTRLAVAADSWWVDLLFCLAAAVIGLVVGRAVRLPASAILGPLLAAAGLHAVPGLGEASVPAVVAAAGFLAIGVHVGLQFTTASLRAIGRMLPTAMVTIVVTIAACAGLGWVLTLTTDQSGLDAYLATTPGGVYAVLGTAAGTGADVAFVTAAQVLRVLILLGSAPFVAAFLRRFDDPPAPPEESP